MKSAVPTRVWRSAQSGHLETWRGFAQRKLRGHPDRREAWTRIIGTVEESARIPAGARVLDIGGGLDTVLDFLPQVSGFGLDPLAARLAALDGDAPARNTAGVIESIPFRDGSFDQVFAMNVLDHVRGPAAGLGEILRVLRPGGHLILSVDVFAGRKYYEKKLHKWWGRARRARTKHPWVFSMGDVQRLLRDAGFETSDPRHVPGTKGRRWLFVAARS